MYHTDVVLACYASCSQTHDMPDVSIDACNDVHIGIMVVPVAFAVVEHVICIRSIACPIGDYCLLLTAASHLVILRRAAPRAHAVGAMMLSCTATPAPARAHVHSPPRPITQQREHIGTCMLRSYRGQAPCVHTANLPHNLLPHLLLGLCVGNLDG